MNSRKENIPRLIAALAGLIILIILFLTFCGNLFRSDNQNTSDPHPSLNVKASSPAADAASSSEAFPSIDNSDPAEAATESGANNSSSSDAAISTSPADLPGSGTTAAEDASQALLPSTEEFNTSGTEETSDFIESAVQENVSTAAPSSAAGATSAPDHTSAPAPAGTMAPSTAASQPASTTAAQPTTRAVQPTTTAAVQPTTRAVQPTTTAAVQPTTTAAAHVCNWQAVVTTVYHAETRRSIYHPAETRTVHHPEQGHYEDVLKYKPAWDEPLMECHSFCNQCHLDITWLDPISHAIDYHNWASGWYDKDIVVGTIHHEPEPYYEKTWIVDKPAWEEVIVDKPESWEWVVDTPARTEEIIAGYRCPGCGATKPAP